MTQTLLAGNRSSAKTLERGHRPNSDRVFKTVNEFPLNSRFKVKTTQPDGAWVCGIDKFTHTRQAISPIEILNVQFLREKLRTEAVKKKIELSNEQMWWAMEIIGKLPQYSSESTDVTVSEDDEVVFVKRKLEGDYFLVVDRDAESLYLAFSGSERGKYFAKEFEASPNGLGEILDAFV